MPKRKSQVPPITRVPGVPGLPVRPHFPKTPAEPVFPKGPRAAQGPLRTEVVRYPPPPNTWVGTLPEWLVYWALEKHGYKEGVDFTFQSSQMGVRYEAGAAVVDFLITRRMPFLVIRVQGMFWHWERGSEKQATDMLQRQELEAHGMEVVDVDEDDVLADPIGLVDKALRGIDVSRAAQVVR